MLNASPAFREAVVADSRRVVARAVVEVISPDIVEGTPTSAAAAPFAQLSQLTDKVFAQSHPYATLEINAWPLDSSRDIYGNGSLQGQQAFTSAAASDDDGTYQSSPWVEVPFSGVSILQACAVFFESDPLYGLPSNFTVQVLSGETVGWSETVSGNAKKSVSFTGFTVHDPTALRVIFHASGIPGRMARVSDVVLGIYETWDNDDLVSVDIKQQGDPSCVSLPYGTMTIAMDNSAHRFDPGQPGGLIASLEDRQGIRMSMGVRLPDGTDELLPVGIYYQYQGGWKTGAASLSMTWNMVDIIGLLTDRTFNLPPSLPTTLKGWVEAIVAQLGVNFVGKYTVVPSVANTAVTANSAEDITGLSCGDILRYACMIAGAWPRAGNQTGDLVVEPVSNLGTTITLDNLTAYPQIAANKDMASVTVTIFDGSEKPPVYTAAGRESSSQNLTVNNPFVHTQTQAKAVAEQILSWYGGQKISTTGRGDPSSEIGDWDTVELNPQATTQGRRIYQTLNISGGILAGCKSQFLVPPAEAQ